jgi:uncharacterized sulfatase
MRAGLFAACLLGATPGWAAEEAPAPNIVWIWADNLAYRDIGCYGNTRNRTPVIDELAKQGARLTQFYVAHVVCSPSRAGLLTGRQPFRTGIVDVLRPDSPSGLPAEEITLAEALKKQGYATMAIGKWHLGDRPQFLPTRQGFDGYLGLPYSMDMLPTLLIRDEKVVEDLSGPEVAHVTERFTDEAIRFVEANKGRRFFLYLAHSIPHPPLNLPEGAVREGQTLYGASIEHLDGQVGRLLEALHRLGLDERTLVVFTSDNGPMATGSDTGELRGRIRDSYEGGLRVPFIARWPGRIPAGRVVDTPAIAYDAFPTFVGLAGGTLESGRTYDGQDILPLLTGQGAFRRKQPFVWVYDDNITALREGPWKLLLGNADKTFPKPQLYQVIDDPGEAHDVAAKHPEVVEKMVRYADEFRQQVPKVWVLKYPVRDPEKAKGSIRRK